jgi:hypothetical protein
MTTITMLIDSFDDIDLPSMRLKKKSSAHLSESEV